MAAEAPKKIQIYSSASSSAAGRQVTPFWIEKYEKDAKKYWDVFYRRHKDKFFKDRHYLDKEWGRYFQAPAGEKLVVLEVGCGAGNTIFPLVSTYPHIFVHACDFSPRAIDLVKAHQDFICDQINAFVCDLTMNDLSEIVQPSSVDIVTMVFVLSAVAPEKMSSVLQNIRKVLKPNGRVLFRDYAIGDLAQERLTSKEQMISKNFYVRGDGTRAYYFSNDFLTQLFAQNGFDTVEVLVHSKQVENRSLELVMSRRWIQAAFSVSPSCVVDSTDKTDLGNEERISCINHSDILVKDTKNEADMDMSETIAEMFGTSISMHEVIEINVRRYNFRIKALSREHQHTCKSTGLMLWESARFMCNVLAENTSIVMGKRVLELGCGSAGICSMVAVQTAKLVVSTDGDAEALDLLSHNVVANVEPNLSEKMVIKRLIWGNREDLKAIKNLSSHGGFEVIIGTDVTYNSDAISPLFVTARELISVDGDTERKSALILCHIQRRVHEETILSTASQFGFKLVDMWTNGMCPNSGIISTWLSQGAICDGAIHNAPLAVMYFHAEETAFI